ncbi:hypothetical protein ACIBI3_08480 [Actinomadura luteofluorescens]|uniref:hypothetical protein n=1 Tax=Actinomadura luteofluorescens TaxID=46163 RepID=UPI00378FD8A3
MPIIEVSGLRKVYGGRPVADGVTFAVEEAEIFGILGPNGAGNFPQVREADCHSAFFAPAAP